jgi:hypothetical protein
LPISKFGFAASYTKNLHRYRNLVRAEVNIYLPLGSLGKSSNSTINIEELYFQLLHKKIHCIAIITRLVQPRAKFQINQYRFKGNTLGVVQMPFHVLTLIYYLVFNP